MLLPAYAVVVGLDAGAGITTLGDVSVVDCRQFEDVVDTAVVDLNRLVRLAAEVVSDRLRSELIASRALRDRRSQVTNLVESRLVAVHQTVRQDFLAGLVLHVGRD